MINVTLKLLSSYYECLQGLSVPVYQLGVPADVKTDYIWLRAESENDTSNRHHFVTNPVIIVEIVTHHTALIDASVVETIDNEIKQAVFPTRRTLGLPEQQDIQILNVRVGDGFYIDEFDGAIYRHRKVLRFTNRINQLLNVS